MRHPHYTAKVFDKEKFSSLIISINAHPFWWKKRRQYDDDKVEQQRETLSLSHFIK